mmetsp:Transcript_46263/g.75488  ORF Transcript_46263/g.75488 Transcript_46263/m.75488 type:complete len:107 (-) Transcript_46263:173-493(-)
MCALPYTTPYSNSSNTLPSKNSNNCDIVANTIPSKNSNSGSINSNRKAWDIIPTPCDADHGNRGNVSTPHYQGPPCALRYNQRTDIATTHFPNLVSVYGILPAVGL